MDFEYDQQKSKTNLQKHGIDFEQAKDIWQDKFAIESALSARGEERFLVIGEINNKLWSAIITYRNDNVRIISVRRARDYEEKTYHDRRSRREI